MSDRNSSSQSPYSNLHAPLATLIVGVTGNTDPVGYDPTVVNPALAAPSILVIYLKVWQFLDWVFGSETPSPIGLPSFLLPKLLNEDAVEDLCLDKNAPRLQNRCEFLSGKLEAFNACWKPLAIQNTPVVLLSSIAPGIDTLVAEVFLDYQKANPSRPVFVRAPLPFPKEILEQCSSYEKDEDKVRLRSLLVRLREQAGWDEDRDLFCVKIDSDWEPLAPRISAKEDPIAIEVTCEAEQSLALQLGPEADLKSKLNYMGDQKSRRNLRYRAAGEYIASLSHLLLAIYDHNFDHLGNKEDEFRKPLNPFEPGTWAIVEAKRRGLSWELLAASNNFSWADNGPVLRLGISRTKRETSSHTGGESQTSAISESIWEFLHPYDLEPHVDDNDPHKVKMSDRQRKAIWGASGDFVFRRIIDFQESYNKETKSKWKPTDPQNAGELELIDMIVPKSQGKTLELKRTKLIELLGEKWEKLQSLGQAASVRRCSGDLANKVYEPKRFRILWALILLVFVAAFSLGMFEHWHRLDPDGHSLRWQPSDVLLALVSYLPAGDSHSNSVQPWIRAGLLAVSILTLSASGVWFIFYNRARIEQKRYDYRAIAEALRVQIYWCVAGLNRSVAHDYMQRQKDELDWIRYVVSEVSFPLERWPKFFSELTNQQQNTLLRYVKEKWIGGQIENSTKKCASLSHKLHLTHVLCWGLAWAGLIQLPFMLLSEISVDFQEWLKINHWLLTKIAFFSSSIGLLVLIAFGIELAIHSIKSLKPWVPKWLSTALHWVDHNFGQHEEPVAEPHLGRKIISNLVHYWQLAGVALFVGGLAFEMSYHLPELGEAFPDRSNWWIINTGACLLAGALMLAWQERRFYSEEYRNYCSMRTLYRSANRRLDLLLKELESTSHQGSNDWTRQRLVAEAQDILYQVGCEALNENAEWLILHRARPLEPFMAG